MNLQYAPWMDDAACATTDPDAWFPEPGGTPAPAKRICGACDVKAQCLTYALEIHPVAGVWGATTLHERTRMLREAA